MAGTAYIDSGAELLVPGAPCIITVNDVNYPTGRWWGVVVESTDMGTHITVRAEITGRFELDNYSNPVVARTAAQGIVPQVNYRVYPNTEAFRHLLWDLELAERATRKAEEGAAAWKKMHLETMEHLSGRGGEVAAPKRGVG